MKNPNINVVVIRPDGLVSSSQCSSWVKAAEAAIDMATGLWSMHVAGSCKILMSAGEDLEEHTVRDLREGLASGEIAKADAAHAADEVRRREHEKMP